MKKKLSFALSLVLCAVLLFALGAVAFAVEGETPALSGEFTIFSTVYYWGEEVNTIEVDLDKALDADTVSIEDFDVRSESLDWRGRPQVLNYTVNSVAVDGKKLSIGLDLYGTGVNTGAVDAFKVDLVGSVKDVSGTEYKTSNFICVAQVNPQVDQFLEGETDNVKYRLFVPETDEAAPLYVWLHGGGEFGDDNRIHISCSTVVNYASKECQDAFGGALYVLSIQSPKDAGGHQAASIMEAIQKVCSEYNIDMGRIYVAGCSMGGRGVHTVISAYPDFFAAAIPNCPASTLTEEAAATLVNTPVMYVHALTDGTVNVTNTINSYNRLIAAGSEKVWSCYFQNTGTHDVTGNPNDTHWSWRYLHANFTCDEENYVHGSGTYTRNDVEYKYVSTDLEDLGYGSIWAWIADQSREPVLAGDFILNASSYYWGQEVDSIELQLYTALDPATVSANDFRVYSASKDWRGRDQIIDYKVESVAVDGKTITIVPALSGTGVNGGAVDAYKVEVIGSVAGADGTVYTSSDLICVKCINPKADLFIAGETENVKYRLYTPETDEAAPLYVWLHGAGEFGTDNEKQLLCSNLPEWTNKEVQDIFGGALYVAAIQSPRGGHKADQIMDAIQQICNEYKIDMSRIYIAGCSMGGMGVHTVITEYPNFFAAAIPNCPASTLTAEQAAKLVDLPIMYVHAMTDRSVNVTSSINSYNNLIAAGSKNVWACFFQDTGTHDITGNPNDTHWSWRYIHANFTCDEENYIVGSGIYERNNVEYIYTSTDLADLGYANIASWLADQQREPVLIGEYTIYSTCYDYGEEAHTITLNTGVELDPATISAEDFELSYLSGMCGYTWTNYRSIESIEVEGTTITLHLVMTGSGANASLADNFTIKLIGEVADINGNVFTSSDVRCIGQINEELDKFQEFVTEDVQYRLYVPETDEEAPLYIWLHGAGEFGSDNRVQVSCSSLVNWIEPEVQDIFGGALYIAAIQSPTAPHDAAKVMDAIMDICTNYDIDMSRIYLAGCSMGGMGVHTMITAYPDFFAAAIPNCPASVITAEQAATLVDLPILYVHALDDTSVRISNSITSYDNLVAAGSDNVWCAFFENCGPNPVTGRLNQGHWSWVWIHNNFTSTEDEFVVGEGVYTGNEIEGGYANVAEWFAAHKNENVVYVDNFTATQGEAVSIPVYIDNAANLATFRFSFNSDKLVINDIVIGDAIEASAAAFEYNPANGMVTWAGLEDLNGDGLLFTINATVVDPTADGEYTFGLDLIEIYDGEGNAIESTMIDGFMTVVNPHYTGDVNCDGSITNADVITLARYLVELIELNEEQLALADFDGNGEINNIDLIKLARYIIS